MVQSKLKGGIKMVRYKQKGRETKAPPRAEFEFLYYDCNLKAEELAEKYHVKTSTIYNWATKYRKTEKDQI